MKDKKKPPLIIEDIDELAENEEYLTANSDIELLVFAMEEEEMPVVYVKIMNFNDIEEAEDYADTLKKNLPLLLLETTVKH
jgi:hypothetical protein